MNLFIDVETIPSQHPEALALVRASIKPPATLKKAESIAAWWASEADTAAQEAWRKQSFDGTVGEIISVAVTDGDSRQWVRCRTVGESEAALLQDFIDTIEQWTADECQKLAATCSASHAFPMDDHTVVAHNAAFDVPFLWKRCAIHGIRIPRWLPPPSARPGRGPVCTMLLWAGYGGRIALDALTKALGLPSPKGDMDGSMVFDAWQAGQHEAIAQYNLADAQAVAAVWHRLQTVGAV